MSHLRRLAGPLALLLALVVAGEVTDLMPCADADCGVWSLVLGDQAPPDSGAPAGSPACLCHVAFAPDAAVPGVPVPEAAALSLPAAVVAGNSAGPLDVPHPPPLG